MKAGQEDLSDSDLALLAQKGDAGAFELIYDRHADGVSRALATFAGPDRDALEDLTQEVFSRVIHGLATWVPSHPFASWLYTIALNVGRNHARRRSKVVPVNPSDLEHVPHTGSPSEWSEDVAARTLMRLASRLPVAMRDVLALRVGSDLPYGDIAELLGIPEGTARSRMYNAVKMLRQQVRVHEDDRRRENE